MQFWGRTKKAPMNPHSLISGFSLNKKRKNSIFLPRFLNFIAWVLFLFTFLTLFLPIQYSNSPSPIDSLVVMDGITHLMGMTITFFTAMIMTYSLRYMWGSKKINAFFLKCFFFMLSMLMLVASDHFMLFILFWGFSGLWMAKLIGHFAGFMEAGYSERYSRKFFFLSTLLLTGVFFLIYRDTGLTHLSTLDPGIRDVSKGKMITISILLLLAGMIRAGIYPFQGWLMSSMTAPTPASALMHAGFVNAGGFLIARFHPVFVHGETFWLLFLIGGVGALFGKFWKFVQTNIKRKLACSTVAQMGFMLLQCGLGYFSAALAHLVLHGSYKAYLFLSNGETIERQLPDKEVRYGFKVWHLPLILVNGVLGGLIFMYMTGKGWGLGTGTFLVFVVILSFVHAAQDILRSQIQKGLHILLFPPIMMGAVCIYSWIFIGISSFLKGNPISYSPMDLSAIHITIGCIYALVFIIIEFEWYKKSERAFVQTMNSSQPAPDTLLK